MELRLRVEAVDSQEEREEEDTLSMSSSSSILVGEGGEKKSNDATETLGTRVLDHGGIIDKNLNSQEKKQERRRSFFR